MWLMMTRPVSYYYQPKGTEILSMGHPLLFWTSIATIPYVAWSWWKRQDWRAGFIVIAILFQYLAWFFFASRVEFLFYMTPVTPFLVLAAAYSLQSLWDAEPEAGTIRLGRGLVVAYLMLYVAMFIFFYPVLTGWHLSYDAWHIRMWMPFKIGGWTFGNWI
jgi:dolichyl-phosphate-mannose--protein O-mannosyl transferase